MADTEPRRTPIGQHEANWAALLLLAALMLLGQHLPWSLAAAVPAVAALVLSIRATSLRARHASRAAAVWSGIGVLFSVWLLLDVAASAVLYSPLDEYSRCHVGANTQVAEGACVDALEHRVGSFATQLVGG